MAGPVEGSGRRRLTRQERRRQLIVIVLVLILVFSGFVLLADLLTST